LEEEHHVMSTHNSRDQRGVPPGQLSAQAARRLAAATQRINNAKRLGPKATIEAVRVSLLSAVKANPSQTITAEVADHVLIKLHELYRGADHPGTPS
jgi:hypothetical protein